MAHTNAPAAPSVGFDSLAHGFSPGRGCYTVNRWGICRPPRRPYRRRHLTALLGHLCRGQYLAALDDRVRENDENPSIGIILSKEKSRTIVEYALRDARKPIGVATCRTVKRLPKELKGQLTSPEEIIKLLEGAL